MSLELLEGTSSPKAQSSIDGFFMFYRDLKDVTPSSPSRHLKQHYVDMIMKLFRGNILMLQRLLCLGEQVGSHRINCQRSW